MAVCTGLACGMGISLLILGGVLESAIAYDTPGRGPEKAMEDSLPMAQQTLAHASYTSFFFGA
jgi:hypothetical protein